MVFTLLGAFTVRADENFTLTMQIDNPVMSVNGTHQEIDEGNGTAPVRVNERTLVPIRAIIEAMDGRKASDCLKCGKCEKVYLGQDKLIFKFKDGYPTEYIAFNPISLEKA